MRGGQIDQIDYPYFEPDTDDDDIIAMLEADRNGAET